VASLEKFPRSRAYRDRAEECRAIAKSLHGEETEKKLLKIAEEYDRMAMQAAAIEMQQAELDDLVATGIAGIRRNS
jgi:hypothetical protein